MYFVVLYRINNFFYSYSNVKILWGQCFTPKLTELTNPGVELIKNVFKKNKTTSIISLMQKCLSLYRNTLIRPIPQYTNHQITV